MLVLTLYASRYSETPSLWFAYHVKCSLYSAFWMARLWCSEWEDRWWRPAKSYRWGCQCQLCCWRSLRFPVYLLAFHKLQVSGKLSGRFGPRLFLLLGWFISRENSSTMRGAQDTLTCLLCAHLVVIPAMYSISRLDAEDNGLQMIILIQIVGLVSPFLSAKAFCIGKKHLGKCPRKTLC